MNGNRISESLLRLSFSTPQAVRSQSAFCLKVQDGFPEELDAAVQQWGQAVGPGTHVILGNVDTQQLQRLEAVFRTNSEQSCERPLTCSDQQ